MTHIKKLRDYGFNTDNRTYIIAEIGINHGGNLDTAKHLIESASRTGCDAVKFQTYRTETRAPNGNQAVFDILKGCELSFDIFGEIKDHATDLGVEFFSTAFDRESVECLKAIETNLYKVASFDVVNRALLRDVAATGKPVIMSVGMAERAEIEAAYSILKQGTDNIAILHCMSSYPLDEIEANLAALYRLQEAFDCVIGYSDHTPEIQVPLYAVAAGAQIIEKHYKTDDNMDCPDAPVSITEEQMKTLVQETRRIEAIFGKGEFGVHEVEKPIILFRRSTA